ncbi:hypothetical protein GCM10010371_56830 [Streptomyces subrutilus]|uniref:Uncharacterized protein n=1 Tax=Streptomyces subrutilus TaxID=36818 RepID=A0A918R7U9_9ACTN|nr:hypothetical protein [Streptomyces subrutilus]GGZ89593.1 hypothetical protein GCM10010371_56830 [Streptomyces subrutilus]
MNAEAAHRNSVRLRVGDLVTGRSYVEPQHRSREQPRPITGTVSQIGSGWAGVDDAIRYVWVRLPCGREAKALARDVEKAPAPLPDKGRV